MQSPLLAGAVKDPFFIQQCIYARLVSGVRANLISFNAQAIPLCKGLLQMVAFTGCPAGYLTKTHQVGMGAHKGSRGGYPPSLLEEPLSQPSSFPICIHIQMWMQGAPQEDDCLKGTVLSALLGSILEGYLVYRSVAAVLAKDVCHISLCPSGQSDVGAAHRLTCTEQPVAVC